MVWAKKRTDGGDLSGGDPRRVLSGFISGGDAPEKRGSEETSWKRHGGSNHRLSKSEAVYKKIHYDGRFGSIAIYEAGGRDKRIEPDVSLQSGQLLRYS